MIELRDKAIIAAMISLDADIENGTLGYAASMALVAAFESAGVTLPKTEKERIWGALRGKQYIFDAKAMRAEEYGCMVAIATWNSLRHVSPGSSDMWTIGQALITEFQLYNYIELW